MRAVTYLLIGAIAAPVSVPTGVAAQDRYDRGDRNLREAVDACAAAVPRKVRDQFPQAYDVRISRSDPLAQGRREVSVRGDGEFRDRNGGSARFDYSCAYDARANRTYGLDVYDVRPVKDPNDKKDNSAAIAGLVLGAIVIGAIAASSSNKDKDRDKDAFSPASGVRCVPRERACYEGGRFSRHWTDRIFVGGR
ncbi:hypothetical protein [Phenylobacterium sp.]|uniref:hypothetical protein n=1 Tax=Phenylobacterium sp. TaxID=1871053 RepID=UPI0025EB028D|nr:hypothetical protein [Phenylobacterium sp.]MBX3485942.1 hypothetical protein [Phenylobacterium sp.]